MIDPESGLRAEPTIELSPANADPRIVPLNSTITVEPNDSHRLAALCGPYDQNLKHLEKRLGVHIRNRGNRFQISGAERRVRAGAVVDLLAGRARPRACTRRARGCPGELRSAGRSTCRRSCCASTTTRRCPRPSAPTDRSSRRRRRSPWRPWAAVTPG